MIKLSLYALTLAFFMSALAPLPGLIVWSLIILILGVTSYLVKSVLWLLNPFKGRELV